MKQSKELPYRKRVAVVFESALELVDLVNISFKYNLTKTIDGKFMTLAEAYYIMSFLNINEPAISFTPSEYPRIDSKEFWLSRGAIVHTYEGKLIKEQSNTRSHLQDIAINLGSEVVILKKENLELKGDLTELLRTISEEKVINQMLTDEDSPKWLIKRYNQIKEREELGNDI
jgi:hypothetical protein